MNKNYIFYFTLFTIPFLTFLLLSNAGGKTGQYSGSPGDNGNTCMPCHSGGTFTGVAQITSTIPDSGFELGETYSVTLLVESTSPSRGFQLTTEDINNDKVGTYTAGTDNQVVNGGTHMTHTVPGNSGTSWTFDWTAPSIVEGGEITFYAAVNLTNANGNTSGDNAITTSTTYSLAAATVAEHESITFSVHPNPTTDFISLDNNLDFSKNAEIIITNSNGQVVSKTTMNHREIDVRNLKPGIYTIEILSASRKGTARFIKK